MLRPPPSGGGGDGERGETRRRDSRAGRQEILAPWKSRHGHPKFRYLSECHPSVCSGGASHEIMLPRSVVRGGTDTRRQQASVA